MGSAPGGKTSSPFRGKEEKHAHKNSLLKGGEGDLLVLYEIDREARYVWSV